MLDSPHFNSDWQLQLESVYRLYAALARGMDPDTGLGGKLLYAGELHQDGCRLVRAANIAGAASLAASADPDALRRANREGVADFLVTSLDEAMRILKNEVRKRQAVSVAVSVAPSVVVAEMLERGVLPDLLRPVEWNAGGADLEVFLAQGARPVAIGPLPDGQAFRVWAEVSRDFDTAALAVIPESDHLNRRWLRLSPRYLGPDARRARSLGCAPEIAARLAELGSSQERAK
jgi:urocanate hydratase